MHTMSHHRTRLCVRGALHDTRATQSEWVTPLPRRVCHPSCPGASIRGLMLGRPLVAYRRR